MQVDRQKDGHTYRSQHFAPFLSASQDTAWEEPLLQSLKFTLHVTIRSGECTRPPGRLIREQCAMHSSGGTLQRTGTCHSKLNLSVGRSWPQCEARFLRPTRQSRCSWRQTVTV